MMHYDSSTDPVDRTAHAPPRLEVEDLSLEVTDGDGAVRRLLDGVTFFVPAGAVFTVLGPSGSGKSSLLRCLNRLTEPSAGRIRIDGQDVLRLPVRQTRRRIGMVFQQPVLFPGTIAQNVTYGPRARGVEAARSEDFVADLLVRVGLPPDWAGHDTHDLSGGEAQRVALARALANEPEVLLLDEPTAALDRGASARVERLLIELEESTALTLVWVTHDLDQAQRIGHSGLILVDGRVVEQGSLSTLLDDPAAEPARLFISGDLPPGSAVQRVAATAQDRVTGGPPQ